MSSSLVGAHPSLGPHLKDGGAGPQRARLLEAITLVVAEKGYVAATVADVVRAARVSRGTFYAEFASKEECFLEAYRYGVDVLVDRISAATRAAGEVARSSDAADRGAGAARISATAGRAGQSGWQAELRAGLRAYLEALAGEPLFARTHMLELHAAGPRAQAERDSALRRFAARYRRSFEAAAKERPELLVPSDDLLFILAAGVDQLVCARVREAPLERLPALEDTLVQAAEALLEGTANVNDPGSPRWT